MPTFAIYRLFANHQIELLEVRDGWPDEAFFEGIELQKEWDRYVIIDLTNGRISAVYQVEQKLVVERMTVRV